MKLFKSILLLFFVLVNTQGCAQLNTKKLQREQTTIVSGLTGASKIGNNKKLKHRWDIQSRIIARNYLANWIENTGLKIQEHPYTIIDVDRLGKKTEFKGTNIYSIIPATNTSDEYIVIGAHFDSVENSPGANDNATGCALLYGVSKKIATLKTRAKNIIVVFFDQEEIGCIGSLAFAKFIKTKKYNVHSVHTIDQMGWDQDNDRNIEIELPTPTLKAIYQKHAKLLGVSALTTIEAGSDHRRFRASGFNAVGITEEYQNKDTTPHYHRSTDTFETVNFEYLSFSTELICNVIEELLTE